MGLQTVSFIAGRMRERMKQLAESRSSWIWPRQANKSWPCQRMTDRISGESDKMSTASPTLCNC